MKKYCILILLLCCAFIKVNAQQYTTIKYNDSIDIIGWSNGMYSIMNNAKGDFVRDDVGTYLYSPGEVEDMLDIDLVAASDNITNATAQQIQQKIQQANLDKTKSITNMCISVRNYILFNEVLIVVGLIIGAACCL